MASSDLDMKGAYVEKHEQVDPVRRGSVQGDGLTESNVSQDQLLLGTLTNLNSNQIIMTKKPRESFARSIIGCYPC